MLKKIITGVLIVLAGVAMWPLVWMQMTDIDRTMSLRSNWPTTRGTVINSNLVGEFLSDDNVDIVVEFAYQIDDMRYVGKQTWSVGEELFGSTPPEAKAAIAKYSAGTVVTVYYNPMNHSESALEPRALDISWKAYFFGMVFIAGMILPIAGIVVVGKGIYKTIVFYRARKHNQMANRL